MKILWLCHLIPGAVKEAATGKKESGLWLDHVLDDLRGRGVKLHVICKDLEGRGAVDEDCTYSGFMERYGHKYIPKHESFFRKELRDFQPDVIHIWGTEYAHSLAMMKAAEAEGMREKCVISIQGLVSVCSRHFAEGLSHRVRRQYTLRDLLRWDNIDHQAKVYRLRGELEQEALRMAPHVIGRTAWDRACTRLIAPKAEYHFCNETLRDPFYTGAWSYAKCQKHRIFASSCVYPLKGFHYLLEAFVEVLRYYPDATLAVPGNDFVCLDTPVKKLRENSYHRYMRRFIEKHGIRDKIFFLGRLSPEEMKEQDLLANVFAMPSTIENSPNSLGEAMLLGTPCVASDVGGISTMMTHGTEGYIYQSTAPYMLAHYIMEVFSQGEKVQTMGLAAAKHARTTHDPRKNLEDLMTVYEKIAHRPAKGEA